MALTGPHCSTVMEPVNRPSGGVDTVTASKNAGLRSFVEKLLQLIVITTVIINVFRHGDQLSAKFS